MRRCKYFYNCIVITHKHICKIIRGCKCLNYTPVEVDPYWKDIIDETNRRLYDR